MKYPVIDFHCDLLLYLGLDPTRAPADLSARCALPQLRQGEVKLQALAVFTETGPSSILKGEHQVSIYQKLPEQYPKDFQHFAHDWALQSSQINLCMAFENGSGFCDENEPLEKGLARLNKIASHAKPLYISLTWNSENRFGGGVFSKTGLKEDGKELLNFMSGSNIALDLSHASDALAFEAIDYIEDKRLTMPVMASHSNARSVFSLPRNLPDEIAKEIFRRKGIIGMNLFRPFIGNSYESVVNHLAHWLEMGGGNSIVLGSDFFNDADLPSSSLAKYGKEQLFFKEYSDSSCYPALFSFIQKELRLDQAFINKFSHQNGLAFIKKIYV